MGSGGRSCRLRGEEGEQLSGERGDQGDVHGVWMKPLLFGGCPSALSGTRTGWGVLYGSQ
jgi:hypothetical protein